MGFIKRAFENKASKIVRQDPAARALIEFVESWGNYDYSRESRNKADEAYSIIARQVGDSPAVKSRYEEMLRISGLPIPLCAIYSFVVEDHIATGMWDPQQTRLQQARQSAQGISLFFPEYRKWVERHHSGAEMVAVLAISSNYLDDFLH